MFCLDSDLHSTADQTRAHDQTSLWNLLWSLGDPEKESFYSGPAMFSKYGPLTSTHKFRIQAAPGRLSQEDAELRV